jgi:hypothetical protein
MIPASDIMPKVVNTLGFASVYDLERYLGLTSYPISKLVRRGSPLSITVIHQLIEAFPHLNPVYLLTGKGKPTLTPEARKVLGL